MPQPTLGTLIMVSSYISEMPEFAAAKSKDAVMATVIDNAKECGSIARLCAALLLGAKKVQKRPVLGAMRLRRLSRRIMLDASPSEAKNAVKTMLFGLEMSDFFSLTTFLQGLNVTKPTKVETETEATVSGQ